MFDTDFNARPISRRKMMGAVGVAGSAFLPASSALTAKASSLENSAAFVRPLGSSDLFLAAPALLWSELDGQSIAVSLTTTGRPVRLTARVPLDYGGPEGTGVGISFAEDGVDLHEPTERGLAYMKIDAGTIASGILEATTVRAVSAGSHTWTLKLRHENPQRGLEAQRTYCRTKRMSPLEFVVVEL